MEWKITKGVICGVVNKDYSQDSISLEPKDDYACVVMADGAGSAPYAKEGSAFTTATVLDILRQYKDVVFGYNIDEIRNIILDNLQSLLKQKAKEEGNELDDYMCTLMFFITDGKKYIIGNLGDGLIGCMNKEKESRVLSLPENGKFRNQTYFITQPEAYTHFRIGMGRYDESQVYFLMTDGSAHCLYNFREGTFANALNVFCEWTRLYNQYEVNNFLLKAMYKLFPQKTKDDCSLAMIYLRER